MTSKFRSFRAESIVLKHSEWGEADRILTLFTREQGKIKAIAKGVRKIRSRRAGHLEPFTHVSLQLASSKDMPIVTQAETIESFPALREDLVSIGQASYLIELLDRFTYEEGENVALFNLLRSSLERLANPDADKALRTRAGPAKATAPTAAPALSSVRRLKRLAASIVSKLERSELILII